MEELKQDFPPGLDYADRLQPDRVHRRIDQRGLQDLPRGDRRSSSSSSSSSCSPGAPRSSPSLPIPVSLIGTFAVMAALGFSLNMLTLFGLVLAIGIVVDDAIVVVENVERNIAARPDAARGGASRPWTRSATAVIAISLVLIAVFVPTAFIPGISGQFYQQFALTIAVSTLDLGLQLADPVAGAGRAPAEAARQRHGPRNAPGAGRPLRSPTASIAASTGSSHGYAAIVGFLVEPDAIVMLAIYRRADRRARSTWRNAVPRGFIPTLDQGYAIVVIQLPDGASLARTDAVVKQASRDHPGRRRASTDAVAFAGLLRRDLHQRLATPARSSPASSPFEERLKAGPVRATGSSASSSAGCRRSRRPSSSPPAAPGARHRQCRRLQDAAAGARRRRHARVLAARATRSIGTRQPDAGADRRLHHLLARSSPQFFLDDRPRQGAHARTCRSPTSSRRCRSISARPMSTTSTPSAASTRCAPRPTSSFRVEREDILQLKVRSATGALVPLGTLVEIRDVTGPDAGAALQHVPVGAACRATPRPASSSATALDDDGEPRRQALPHGDRLRVDRARLPGAAAPATRPSSSSRLSVLFVFLVLAAQYESWSLPLAIILIVPMCLLAALVGVALRGMDNNILDADRLHRAGRPGGQERHPDRRVRQASARSEGKSPSRRRSRPAGCGCGRS